MNAISKKADNLTLFKHAVFRTDNQVLSDMEYPVKFDLKQINGQIKLHVKSIFFEKDNYNLILIRSRLILFISEKKELEKPLYIHHLDRNTFENSEYEKLRQYEYELPEEDYNIKRINWNKEKNRLEISLNKILKSTTVK